MLVRLDLIKVPQITHYKAITNIALVIFVLFFGYSACDSPAPEETPAKEEIIKTAYKFDDSRVKVADSLRGLRKNDLAIIEYGKAKSEFETERNWEGVAYCLNQMGLTYERLRKDSLANISYREGIEILKSHKPNSLLLSRLYINQGVRSHFASNSVFASKMVDTAMMIYEKAPNYDSLVLKKIYEYKFYTYYYSQLSTDTLIKYLDERGRLFESMGSNLEEDIYLVSNFSRAFQERGDFQKAIAYALEAVRMCEENLTKINSFYYSDALFNLAKSFSGQFDYENALSIANRLIDFTLENSPNSSQLRGYYNLKAVALNGLDRWPEAIEELKRILSLLANRQNSSLYKNSLMNLGVTYQLLGEKDTALYYLQRALQLEKENNEKLSIELTPAYRYLGLLHESKEAYTEAISYQDSALRSTLLDYNGDILEFPKSEDINPTFDLLTILKSKLMDFEKYFRHEANDSLPLLVSTVEYAERTHQYLIANRKELEASAGRLFLSENFKELYESALSASYGIFKYNSDLSYFKRAIWLMSMSKSNLFIEQSGELAEVQNSQLPLNLKADFYKLKSEIENLEQAFFQNVQDIISNDSIRSINSQLMSLNSDLKELEEQFDSNSESLDSDDLSYEQIYSDLIAHLDGRTNSAVIEFFKGSEALYLIGISKEKHVFKRIDMNEEFQNDFSKILKIVSRKPNVKEYKIQLKEFQASAHRMYQVLLEDAIHELGTIEKLTIIPDDILSRLPFEALLVRNDDQSSFRNLNYLIKNYSIDYALNSRQVFKKGTKKRAKEGLLGIGYSGIAGSDIRGGFGGLPGTEREIKSLQERIEGDYFLGENGTKEQFLSMAKNYDVLHLAIHGKADSLDRYESSLIFNGNDNILRTNDLYVAGINARLAILSACESGVGEVNSGEGTFSIARGFALVGVPSIIMSLWNVNDNAASELMLKFHDELSQGQSTARAINRVKRQYISTADEYTSHPYYWSAFVALGEDIDLKDNKRLYFMGGALLIIAILLATIVKKHLKRKDTQ